MNALVRLFQESEQHRIAYALAYHHCHQRWPNGYELEKYIEQHVRASRAIADLPVVRLRAADGTIVCVKFISPHLKHLPAGYLPFAIFDPEKEQPLQDAGWLVCPWSVGDREKGSGRLHIRAHVKRPDGGSSKASLRTILTGLHLKKPLYSRIERVFPAVDGHPGDLRLSKLVLAKPRKGSVLIPRGARTVDQLPPRAALKKAIAGSKPLPKRPHRDTTKPAAAQRPPHSSPRRSSHTPR